MNLRRVSGRVCQGCWRPSGLNTCASPMVRWPEGAPARGGGRTGSRTGCARSRGAIASGAALTCGETDGKSRRPASPAPPAATASLRWMGRCPGCGEWNTLVEEKAADRRPIGGRSRTGARARRRAARAAEPRKPVPLAEVEAVEIERLRTGSDELDRVLGGGLVPGLDRADRRLARDRQEHADERRARRASQAPGRRTLYVSGEESAAQVRLRAERLGAARARGPGAGRDLARGGAGLARAGAARRSAWSTRCRPSTPTS